MTKNIYFDVCAVFIVGLVMFSMIKRHMNRGRTNKWFLIFAGITLYTAVADIAAVLLDLSGAGHIAWKYVAHSAYLVGRSLITMCGVGYLFAKVGEWDRIRRDKTQRVLYVIPALLSLTFVLLINPFWHCMFYIDSNGQYCRGPLMVILYLLSLLYVVFGYVVMLKHKDVLGNKKTVYFLSVFSIGLSATLIQFFYPFLIVEMFSMALCALIVALGVQAPEERLYAKTGLFNFSAFIEDMNLAYQTGSEVNMVIFAITNFDTLKEMLGFEFFNECIMRIAKSLYSLRKDLKLDLELYYLGQGVFSTVLFSEDIDSVMQAAHAINAALLPDFMLNQLEIRFVSNVCVVRFPEDIENTTDLISFGEDLISIDYTGEVRYAEKLFNKREYEIRRNIEDIVNRAISEKSLYFVYQPIYSVEQERYVAAEAFMRLKDPKYGEIPPELVIREAEKSSLIHGITTYLFEELCEFVSGPQFLQLNLDWIEINFSPVQCMWTDLVTVLLSTMRGYHVSPDRIRLNVIDVENFQSFSRMSDNLNALVQSGVKVFMDDFGAGVFEIERLTGLPLTGNSKRS